MTFYSRNIFSGFPIVRSLEKVDESDRRGQNKMNTFPKYSIDRRSIHGVLQTKTFPSYSK